MSADLGDPFNRSASELRLRQVEEDRIREERKRHDDLILGRDPFEVKTGADSTSIGTDIGNFFRVLFAFISGIWKGNFEEFNRLSNEYFPPTEEPPENEVERIERQSVQTMQTYAQNPQDTRNPLYGLSIPRMLSYLTAGLPSDLLRNQPRQVIRDLVAVGESGGHYNIAYNVAPNAIAFTNMTVGEVLEWQRQYKESGTKSTAVGRYQFMYDTLKGLVAENKIDKNLKFDEAMQDKLGDLLLDRRGYRDFISGKISMPQFLLNLSQEWAALPKDARNKSYYEGINGNHSTVNYDVASRVLTAVQEAQKSITNRTPSPAESILPGATPPAAPKS